MPAKSAKKQNILKTKCLLPRGIQESSWLCGLAVQPSGGEKGRGAASMKQNLRSLLPPTLYHWLAKKAACDPAPLNQLVVRGEAAWRTGITANQWQGVGLPGAFDKSELWGGRGAVVSWQKWRPALQSPHEIGSCLKFCRPLVQIEDYTKIDGGSRKTLSSRTQSNWFTTYKKIKNKTHFFRSHGNKGLGCIGAFILMTSRKTTRNDALNDCHDQHVNT